MATVRALGDDPRPLRADALRNAEKISRAAVDAFADRGLEVSMADVAERAEVGVGTVYRRFGDKNGLIDAVFTSQVVELIDTVTSGHGEGGEPDPGKRFADFCLFLCETLAENKGLRQIALSNSRGPAGGDDAALDKIVPLIDTLVDDAKGSGYLRPSFAPTDLLLMVSAVGAIRDFGGSEHPDVWRRVLHMFLDGIRSDSRDPSVFDAPSALADAEVRQMKGARRPS